MSCFISASALDIFKVSFFVSANCFANVKRVFSVNIFSLLKSAISCHLPANTLAIISSSFSGGRFFLLAINRALYCFTNSLV